MSDIITKSVYIFGMMGPVMTIPQVVEIWIKKNVQGVSMLTWGTYLIIALCWVAYGLVKKQKPLIFIYTSWIIVDSLIVAGLMIVK